jgi:hypothetical protein
VRVTAAARVAGPESRREPGGTAGSDRADRVGSDGRGAAERARPLGTRVTVGLTPQCPYGLGACWGGAYEALSGLTGVASVAPVADQADSTAEVRLDHAGLPDLDEWPAEFGRTAGASYTLRGVEVTLAGEVVRVRDGLALAAPGLTEPIPLRPLRSGGQLAWDVRRRRRRPTTAEERGAHDRLRAGTRTTVTGPLRHGRRGWTLAVRTITR